MCEFTHQPFSPEWETCWKVVNDLDAGFQGVGGRASKNTGRYQPDLSENEASNQSVPVFLV